METDTCKRLDMEKLNRFCQLKKERERLDEEMGAVIAEMAELEKVLLDGFEAEGIQHINLSSGDTPYLNRSLITNVKEGNQERAMAALERCGLSDFIKPRLNTQGVGAWVREQEKEGKELPKEFTEAFEVFEKFSLRVRKGA